MKPLLVGESNPYGSDPVFALYPLPEGASGARLAGILGLTRGAYLRSFERINLLTGDRWSIPWAVEVASRLHRERDIRQPFVLLGRRVAEAFRLAGRAPRRTKFIEAGDDPSRWRTVVLLPHPSGRCRVWSDRPEAVGQARALVLALLGDAFAREVPDG